MKSLILKRKTSILGSVVLLVAIVATVSIVGGNVHEVTQMAAPTVVALLAILKGEETDRRLNGELEQRIRDIVRDENGS